MVEIIDYFAGFFSGLLVSVIVSYVQFWFSKKTLSMEIEQNEKNLKLQLLHDDRNKALAELFKIIDREYKSYFDFQSAVESFLGSLSGAFIPSEIAKDIRGEFLKIGGKLDSIGPPKPSEAEEEHWEKQFEKYYQSLPYEDRVGMEVKNMTQAFKSKIKERIRENINAM
jgi:hypothetical protein